MIRTFLAIFILAVSAIAQTGGVPGQPKPVKADQVAGNDGTNLRVIKTDTAGQVIVVGPTGASSNQVQGTAAAGSAGVGNPVVVQGVDVVGTAPTANPVTIGGLDVPNNFIRRYCAFPATADRSTSYGAGGCYNAFALSAGSNLYDRPQSASLANFATAVTTTARNNQGSTLGEFGSRFTVNSAPAAGSQATASIAAEASVRHVATGICFSSGSAVAPVLTSLQVNLRDGATGAGTVLITFEVEIPASTGVDTAPFCTQFTGGIAGTTNTAMTVEWSASLANLKQTATLIGYNVN